MTPRPCFCFVVPCFNEQENIGLTVDTIRSALEPQHTHEIVLVDDCSEDRTLETMKELAARDPYIHVFHNPVNLNFGGAYKRGLKEAKAEYTMMLPGDNGFPADSIAEILRHAGEADIIIPIVVNQRSRGLLRAVLSKSFTALLNWLFWLDVGYYNGAVLQRTVLLRKIEIRTNSFAYQAEGLVKLIACGASFSHCYVRIQERVAGKSSATSFKNLMAVSKTVLHLIASVGIFRKLRIGYAATNGPDSNAR